MKHDNSKPSKTTTKTEVSATRRPWEIYDFDGQVKDYPKTIIVAPTGESICEISGGWPQCTLAENEANAEMIVRAVNNHEALVEALRLVVTRYDIARDIHWRQLGLPRPQDDDNDTIRTVRAVLARIEGRAA